MINDTLYLKENDKNYVINKNDKKKDGGIGKVCGTSYY